VGSTRFSIEWVTGTWLALASYTRMRVSLRRRRSEVTPLPDETPKAEARRLLVVADGLANAIINRLTTEKCLKSNPLCVP
jgi:hypothetical protein